MKTTNSVSVIVLTYNSSTTVISTLESILKQTYDTNDIELIISDDASSDNTSELITEWVLINRHKFYCVKEICHTKNLGIVSNLDNAYREACGEWIKIIAGDDILLPECIDTFYTTALKHNGRVYLSYIQTFHETNGVIIKGELLPPESQVEVLKGELEKQQNHLINSSFSATPSLFIQKSLLEEVSFLDRDFFLMEDYPLWFKITEYGVKIDFVDKVTVLYRVEESVSRSKKNIINLNFLKDILKLESKIVSKIPSGTMAYRRRKIWFFSYPLIVSLFQNKRTFLSKAVLLVVNVMFKPGYLNALYAKVLSKYKK